MDVNDKLAEEVIASRLAGAELAQRLAHTENLKKDLVDELERLQQDLKQAERHCNGLISAGQGIFNTEVKFMPFRETNLCAHRNDIPDVSLGYAPTPPDSLGFFSSGFSLVTSPIEQCLNSQRAFHALNHEKVRNENFSLELRDCESSLAASHVRIDQLAVELESAQATLGDAQWGVLKYQDKCDKQRRQLNDVQSANANLKKENAKLREEVKRLRKDKRELSGGSIDKDKAWKESWRRHRTCDSVEAGVVEIRTENRTTLASAAIEEQLVDGLLERTQKISTVLRPTDLNGLCVVAPKSTCTVKLHRPKNLSIAGHQGTSDKRSGDVFENAKRHVQGHQRSAVHSGGDAREGKLASSSDVEAGTVERADIDGGAGARAETVMLVPKISPNSETKG